MDDKKQNNLIDVVLKSDLGEEDKLALIQVVRNARDYFQQAYVLKQVSVLLAGLIKENDFEHEEDISIFIPEGKINMMSTREMPNTIYVTKSGGTQFSVEWQKIPTKKTSETHPD